MSEKIQGLAIGLDLDTVGVDNGLKTLKSKIALVNSEMKTNLSSFDRSEKSMKKYETQLTGLNKKLEVQKVAVKAAKDEYDEMVKRHGASSDQAQKAAEVYNKQQAAFNNLERYVGSLTDEMKQFEKQQELAASGWTKLGDKLTDTGKKLNTFGEGMKNAGKNMSMYVTAPLVGFAGAAAKIGVDFDDSMAKVQAISGATGQDLEKLREKAKDMGATTKFSASEAAEGLNYMALAGWDTTEMLNGLDGVMALAAASGEDLGAVSDIVTDSLSAFQLQAQDSARFADVLAAASANANTDVSGLGAAFQYVAPVAGALGFVVEDTATAIGLMSNAGIKGEKAGTALRTMMTNLAKPTKAMKDEMDKLGISLTNTDGTMKTFDEIMRELRDSFGDLDEAQQASAAATIFGKEAMSGALAIINTSEADYNKLSTAINESEGSAQKMADTMEGTLGGTLREIKSAAEGFAISMYEEMKPSLEEGAQLIKGFIGWLNDLSPEAKKTALMIGGVAAAVGPLLIVGGTLIAGLGSALTLLGTVSGAIAVMTTGAVAATPAVGALAGIFTVLTGPVGLAIAAIGGLTVAGVLFAKHMSQDAIPEVDRFGDQVSETTKQALGEFFELSDGVGLALSEMKLTSAAVTDEMAEELVGKYASMNDQILEGMKTRHDEQLTTMKDFFANSSALTNEEEQKILEKELAKNEKALETQQYYADKVKEIYETAAAEKRETTTRENEIIDTINKRMQDNAVSYLTESEVEQQIIMQRIKDTVGDLSAQQAAEVVKRATEQKDGTIAAAEEEYENRLAEIIRLRDESGTISDEQATKLIADAKKTRDEAVTYAESMHADVVEQAKLQAGEHVNEVDWSTGEILSKWQVYKNKVIKNFEETNKNSIDDFKRWGADFVSFSEDFSKGAIDAFGRMATGMISKMSTGSQTVLDIKASMVNGIIKGLNWVLEKLDMKTFPLWSPAKIATGSRKTPTTTAVKAYAHGTDGHPGGWALVGDGTGDNAGPEYIRTPDGKHGFSPATNTLLDLPKGTKVLSAKKTRELFGPIPRYAFGIGDIASHVWDAGKDVWNAGKKKVFDIFDYFTDPKKLLDIGLTAVGFNTPSAGGFMKDVLSGSISTIKKGAVDFIKKALTDFGGSGGIGFGSAFRKTSSYGYRIHPILGIPQLHAGDDYGAPVGTPIPAQAGGRVTVSGFHPIRGNYVRIKSGILERIYQHNARNLVSTGDMVKQGQYIGTVGSTGRSTGPHLHYEVLRNGVNINPKGLATGGITNGFMVSSLHEEGYPEFVIPTAPNRRTDAMKLLALAYKRIGGGENATRPNQLPDVPYQSDHTNKIIEKLTEQVQETKEIVSLLTQLLLKDSNTYLDGRKIEQYVSEQQSINSKVRSVF